MDFIKTAIEPEILPGKAHFFVFSNNDILVKEKSSNFVSISLIEENIQYFKSQSWPFPDSLMIGFTAEYESGKITIDTKKIAEADWFNADNLPVIPGKQTLAGELIEWFVLNQS